MDPDGIDPRDGAGAPVEAERLRGRDEFGSDVHVQRGPLAALRRRRRDALLLGVDPERHDAAHSAHAATSRIASVGSDSRIGSIAM